MKTIKLATALFVLFLFYAWLHVVQPNAANFTNIKDTMSSSQLSYFARMGAGVSGGQNVATIYTSGFPSNTTSNLFVGDTIAIGHTGPSTALTPYIVSGIGNTATFSVSSALNVVNAGTSVAIIATRSAIHTLTFVPVNAISNGAFEFLIKATSRSGENRADGIPDQQGFDFGMAVGSTTIGPGTSMTAADIACPVGLGTTTVTLGSGTTAIVGGNTYFSIKCGYSGTNLNTGTTYTMVVGRALSTGSQLTNPAPGLSHTEGSTETAGTPTDIYSYYIRHLNSAGTVIDSTQGKLAVIEAVRVTATVDPIISFFIDNVGSGSTATSGTAIAIGETRCGAPMGSGQSSVNGTSATFGSLSINAFSTIAQRLSVVTNAANGYTLTAYEDKYMTNGVGQTIPDTSCDSSCTSSTPTEWSTATNYGLGYSLEALNGTTTQSFNYNDSGNTFRSKRFGFGSGNAAILLSRTNVPANTERAYVCYRIAIGTAQPAGDYEGRVIYTATATF